MNRWLLLILFCIFSIYNGISSIHPNKARVDFKININGEYADWSVQSIFVTPGEPVKIDIERGPGDQIYVSSSVGTIAQDAESSWVWEAPNESGIYPIYIYNQRTGEQVRANGVVMVPYDNMNSGSINGYNIGDYPKYPLKGLSIYERPKGFIEVTEENQDVYLSPHFQLKQFLCKQSSGFPKYVIVQDRLLLKLELILETVQNHGYPVNTLTVMSGYRTPEYNRAIGNTTTYSRHCYGDAADIFIDIDHNNGLDDLNDDGSVDYDDVMVLYNIIEDLIDQPEHQHFEGGLSGYKKNGAHNGFVHVDARGTKARW